MVKTNRQFLKSLVIVSSLDFQKIDLVESLSFAARQAYFSREYARMKDIGEWLIDLTPRSEHTGRLFVAMANRNLSNRDSKSGTREFESLAENAPIEVRAAAMSTLIADDIYSNNVDNSTIRLLHDASTLAMKSNDWLNLVQLQNQFSLICSLNGDHEQSLEVFKGLQPAVDALGNYFPFIKTDFYNNVAYELNQLGRHEIASVFAAYVLKSPDLIINPEWLETAKEIDESLLISKKTIDLRPVLKLKNLVGYDTFQSRREKKAIIDRPVHYLSSIVQEVSFPCIILIVNSERYSVIPLQSNQHIAKAIMDTFLLGLEEITSRPEDRGTLRIQTYFCTNEKNEIVSDDQILFDHLIHLQNLIDDTRLLEEYLFYEMPDDAETIKEEVERIRAYLFPTLYENIK